MQAKVSLKDDAYEKQPDHAHLLYQWVSVMLAVMFGIGNKTNSVV